MGRLWSPVVLLAGLVLSACGSGPRVAGESSALECAPFARQVTGIGLYGAADSWWDQAAGRYGRTQAPVAGGVLVFRRSARLPSGHVSAVRRLVSPREIRVSQANWVHRRITRDDPVIDVSPHNDWSQVRVWWAPSGAMGSSTYATYGFITPARGDLVAGGGVPAGDSANRLQATAHRAM